MEDRLKAYPNYYLNNKDHKIKAGMYAEVKIVTDVEGCQLFQPRQYQRWFKHCYVVKRVKPFKEVIIGSAMAKKL